MLTGRCYCGACELVLPAEPLTVAYCHCADCKRWTGAPLPAFAAFKAGTVKADPALGAGKSFAQGVRRWTCPECGSPLMATFDYIPDQAYVPLGILDQAADLAPAIHCHSDAQMPWLHISDALPREAGSARSTLSGNGSS